MYWEMPVTSERNSSAHTISAEITALPRNLCLESGKAAIEARITYTKVPTPAMNRLLNT